MVIFIRVFCPPAGLACNVCHNSKQWAEAQRYRPDQIRPASWTQTGLPVWMSLSVHLSHHYCQRLFVVQDGLSRTLTCVYLLDDNYITIIVSDKRVFQSLHKTHSQSLTALFVFMNICLKFKFAVKVPVFNDETRLCLPQMIPPRLMWLVEPVLLCRFEIILQEVRSQNNVKHCLDCLVFCLWTRAAWKDLEYKPCLLKLSFGVSQMKERRV